MVKNMYNVESVTITVSKVLSYDGTALTYYTSTGTLLRGSCQSMRSNSILATNNYNYNYNKLALSMMHFLTLQHQILLFVSLRLCTTGPYAACFKGGLHLQVLTQPRPPPHPRT